MDPHNSCCPPLKNWQIHFSSCSALSKGNNGGININHYKVKTSILPTRHMLKKTFSLVYVSKDSAINFMDFIIIENQLDNLSQILSKWFQQIGQYFLNLWFRGYHGLALHLPSATVRGKLI